MADKLILVDEDIHDALKIKAVKEKKTLKEFAKVLFLQALASEKQEVRPMSDSYLEELKKHESNWYFLQGLVDKIDATVEKYDQKGEDSKIDNKK
jgi:hypothetical protein